MRIPKSLLLTLGTLAAVLLVFNMVAIPLNREQVFIRQDTLSPVEGIILAGFLLVILFDLVSLFWVTYRLVLKKPSLLPDTIALVWGLVCVAMLLGVKAMLDEIARESRLGWETTGEWIVMYIGLAVQLCYLLFMLLRASRSYRHSDKTVVAASVT